MDKTKIKSATERIFRDMGGAMAVGLAYLGTRTGLFRAMAGEGPMRMEAVVERSGLHARYVEEWLKGMVCAGYLDYDADARTYTLSEEHAYLLASDGTDHFAGGLFHMVPPLMGVAPKVAAAFEEGGGVPFDAYGADGRLALDLINRGNYRHRFAGYWLQALPDVVGRLKAGAVALDVGCGVGQVSLSLARAFPEARCVGLDLDQESVRLANQGAVDEGVAARVTFHACSIEALEYPEHFDLITACDCVHDFGAPIAVLRGMRARLKPDGTLFVVEPKVADRLEDNRHPIGAMFYGFSVFHCMTQSLAGGGAGLGTCLGPARTEALMREAGFGRFQVLDIKSQVNAFYAVGA